MSPATSGGPGRRFGAQGEINVTPLIDIVLVLLIVFMVMTPVTLKELRAKVPEAAADQPQPLGDAPLIVELDAQDRITVHGVPVAAEALGARVAERLAHDRRKIVFFRVDDRASYGRAVRLMDVCKGAGARTLAIVTPDPAPDAH